MFYYPCDFNLITRGTPQGAPELRFCFQSMYHAECLKIGRYCACHSLPWIPQEAQRSVPRVNTHRMSSFILASQRPYFIRSIRAFKKIMTKTMLDTVCIKEQTMENLILGSLELVPIWFQVNTDNTWFPITIACQWS